MTTENEALATQEEPQEGGQELSAQQNLLEIDLGDDANPENLTITVQNHYLTAKYVDSYQDNKISWARSWEKTVLLPQGVTADNLHAEYKKGTLTVGMHDVDKLPSSEPTTIAVTLLEEGSES